MARPKKYPKLPNGYGSIKKLSGKRRNNFGVYPPSTDLIAPGQYAPVKAICYVDDYMKGFSVLTAWHAGTYYPGFERTLNDLKGTPNTLLADYSQAFRADEQTEVAASPTFKDIFAEYYHDKFKAEYGHPGKKRSLEYSISAAYTNCGALHDREFSSLVTNDLQKVVDDCPLKHASVELILTLFRQMYRYALKNNLADKDYSSFVEMSREDDDEHGVPFTESELRVLWENADNEVVEFLLIMCYSGYRISAYKSIEVNLKKKYFKGGVKTQAGRNRIVPIHSAIYGLVKRRIRRDGSIKITSANLFRKSMYEELNRLGIPKHTPHDCRHTFSMLCEKYGVNENDRKRLLGHAFDDITNRVYGHRDLEDIRKEIEKIQICH